MSPKILNVHFRGICTHFRGIVPGVPHRTVLPDAASMRTGSITVGKGPVKDYTLPPHYPFISTVSRQTIDVPGLIKRGKIIGGVRLQIVNAVEKVLEYDDEFKRIPALADYVTDYVPSTEVVHGGRARCYFDIFSGHVSSEKKRHERHATIRIRTDGTPLLQVTPLLESSESPAHVWRIELQSEKLVFMNGTKACGGKYSIYDFLLNYLTAQRGIPHTVTSGFPLDHGVLSDDTMTDFRFTSEEEFVPPSPAELIRCLDNEGEHPMCSDSRYP
jgi:hypothetical protein